MSSDNSRSRMQAEAQAAWKAWWEGMTKQEQDTLIKNGTVTLKNGRPELLRDSFEVAGHAPHEERDAAEHPRHCEGFDFTKLDALEMQLAESFDLDPVKAAGIARWHRQMLTQVKAGTSATDLSRLAGALIREDNPKVAVAGLAFALNMAALNGLGSIRDYAKRIYVSPEAISKKKRQWERELDLQPGPHGKTAKSRRALSVAQQEKHKSKKKFKAPHHHTTTTTAS